MKRFDTYLGRIAAAAILLVTGGFLSSCDKNDDGPKLDKITVSVSEVNATATTAVFIGVVERESKAPADAIVGFEYAKSEDFSDATEVTVLEDEFSEKVTGLSTNTKYYYRTFVEKKGQRTYGDVRDFTTSSVSASIETIATSSTKAEIVCLVDPEVAGSASLKAGVEVSLDETFAEVEVIAAETISEDGEYTISMEGLAYNTYYYVRPYIEEGGNRIYGTVKAFATTGVTFALNVTLETALLRVFGSVEVDEADIEALTVGYQVSTDPEFSEAATTTVVIPADQYGNYDSGNKFNYRKPSTDYYYRTYVYVKGDDEYYYNNFSPYTTDALALEGYQLKNVTATSASCMPMYNSNGWDLTGVDEAGDAYSTDENFLTSGNGVTHVAMQDDPVMPGMGFYSISISGLTPATGYYYTYYIKRGSEYEYGPAESVLSFVTLPDASCISVNEVKPESYTPGKVIFTGSSKVSDLAKTTYSIVTSLEYATTEDFSDKVVKEFTGNLSFQKNDLKPATTYYYRIALAYNDGKNDKTLYTAVKSFTTNEIVVNVGAAPANIKATSILLGISFDYSGWDRSDIVTGAILTTDPACELTSEGAIIKESYDVDDPFTGGKMTMLAKYTDLEPATKYYFRSFIKRGEDNYVLGEIKSATTLGPTPKYVSVEATSDGRLYIKLNIDNWTSADKFDTGIEYAFDKDFKDGAKKVAIKFTTVDQTLESRYLYQATIGLPSVKVYYRFYYVAKGTSDYIYDTTYEKVFPDMTASEMVLSLKEVTASSATFSLASDPFYNSWNTNSPEITFGMVCATTENPAVGGEGVIEATFNKTMDWMFNTVIEPAVLNNLAGGTKYYYRSYYKVGETVVYLHNGTFTTTSAPKTVELYRGDVFTEAKTFTKDDVTISFAGITAGSDDNAYMYMKTGSTPSHNIKVTAPKAIKSISFASVNTTAAPCVIRAKSALSDEMTDADMITSYTLENANATDVTLNLTGDATEVWITVSAKTYFKGNVSVTY